MINGASDRQLRICRYKRKRPLELSGHVIYDAEAQVPEGTDSQRGSFVKALFNMFLNTEPYIIILKPIHDSSTGRRWGGGGQGVQVEGGG